MTEAAVLEKVTQSMVELFGLDPAKVRLEARLMEDLDLTSLDAIDLAVELQGLTGTKVGDEALMKLRTVGDVVALVHGQLAAKGS